MALIQSTTEGLLYYFGFLWIFYSLIQFLRFLYLHLRPSSLSLYHNGQSSWALVTGASDGIGLAIARELASHNFNVVLHGRNPSKLEGVRSDLRKQFPNREFNIAVADAASSDCHKAAKDVAKVVGDLHLSILINNVGGTGAVMEPPIKAFEDTTPKEIEGLISLNLRFATHLTRSLLPQFLGDSRPKLIMNIGSLAASGTPYNAVYGGCKAFNHAWSKGWQAELQSTARHIEVLAIGVGQVTATAGMKTASSVFTPNATIMARAALGKIGCGRAEVVGYWGHAVQFWLAGWLPDGVLRRVKVAMMERMMSEQGKSQ